VQAQCYNNAEKTAHHKLLSKHKAINYTAEPTKAIEIIAK